MTEDDSLDSMADEERREYILHVVDEHMEKHRDLYDKLAKEQRFSENPPQSISLRLLYLNVMPSDNDTKSAEALAESTGADSEVISKEYEAAAELAGLSEDSED